MEERRASGASNGGTAKRLKEKADRGRARRSGGLSSPSRMLAVFRWMRASSMLIDEGSLGFGSLLGVATRYIIPHRRSGCNTVSGPRFPLLESPFIPRKRGFSYGCAKFFSRRRPVSLARRNPRRRMRRPQEAPIASVVDACHRRAALDGSSAKRGEGGFGDLEVGRPKGMPMIARQVPMPILRAIGKRSSRPV